MSSSKPKNKSENKTEKQLAAEKEQFGKLQVNLNPTFFVLEKKETLPHLQIYFKSRII